MGVLEGQCFFFAPSLPSTLYVGVVKGEEERKEERRGEAGEVSGCESEEVVEEEGKQKAELVDQDTMDEVTVRRRAKPRTQQRRQEEEGSQNHKTVQIFVKVDGPRRSRRMCHRATKSVTL